MNWAIVRESFLTEEIKGEFTPTDLGGGQYLIRVTSSNEKFLIGIRRYNKEEIKLLTNDAEVEYPEKEEDVVLKRIAPFASNNLIDGKKLHIKTHGVNKIVPGLTSEYLSFSIPYDACKFNEIEVIEDVTMILDFTVELPDADNDPTNNVKIESHGMQVNFGKTTYKRKSEYNADLVKGIILKTKIENKEDREKLVGINFILHEVR